MKRPHMTVRQLKALIAKYDALVGAEFDEYGVHCLDFSGEEDTGLVTNGDIDRFDDEGGWVLSLSIDPNGVIGDGRPR